MKIRCTIGQMRYFRQYVRTPRDMDIPEATNVIELIMMLDKEYRWAIQNDGKPHHKDFLDPEMKSLLQVLWNPKTLQFYEDVAIEAREAPPESESIPIEKDCFSPLTEQSFVVLSPDSGCWWNTVESRLQADEFLTGLKESLGEEHEITKYYTTIYGN